MFKNKGSLYILFPVVVIIWGAIIFKVVAAFGDDVVIHSEFPEAKTIRRKAVIKDTFSLLPVDRDPFLGHSYEKPLKQKVRAAGKKVKVVWPEIFYNGIISGEGTASAVFILQLRGKQILMEKGTSTEGIMVVNGSTNQLKLKYRGASKVFFKTE